MRDAIARRLKELRENHKLTQWELSQLLNMSDSYIAHMEMGRRKPCLKVAFKLEKVLKLKPGEFSYHLINTIREEAEKELLADSI